MASIYVIKSSRECKVNLCATLPQLFRWIVLASCSSISAFCSSRVISIKLLAWAVSNGYELFAHNSNLYRLREYTVAHYLFLAVYQLITSIKSLVLYASLIDWFRITICSLTFTPIKPHAKSFNLHNSSVERPKNSYKRSNRYQHACKKRRPRP